jgi:hypothetical protein
MSREGARRRGARRGEDDEGDDADPELRAAKQLSLQSRENSVSQQLEQQQLEQQRVDEAVRHSWEEAGRGPDGAAFGGSSVEEDEEEQVAIARSIADNLHRARERDAREARERAEEAAAVAEAAEEDQMAEAMRQSMSSGTGQLSPPADEDAELEAAMAASLEQAQAGPRATAPPLPEPAMEPMPYASWSVKELKAHIRAVNSGGPGGPPGPLGRTIA